MRCHPEPRGEGPPAMLTIRMQRVWLFTEEPFYSR